MKINALVASSERLRPAPSGPGAQAGIMHMRIALRCLVVGTILVASSSGRANDSEQVRTGADLFKEYCAVCHGESGSGGPGYANPIWGPRAQIRKFKHAQGLFEYHQILMPFNDPRLLTDDQKWAVTAYVLANHGVLLPGHVLDPTRASELTIP